MKRARLIDMRVVKWIRYVLTDEKNRWDIGVLLWVAGCVEFLYRGWSVSPFDFQAFGIGLAGVLGAGAALQWARSNRDNSHPDDPGFEVAGTDEVSLGPKSKVNDPSH